MIRRRSLPDSLRYLAEKLDGPLTDAERAGIALTLNSLADEAETDRDTFAHELAEQQRAWANSEPRRTSTEYGVAMLMAHLIDPLSAGPVRPGEETTT